MYLSVDPTPAQPSLDRIYCQQVLKKNKKFVIYNRYLADSCSRTITHNVNEHMATCFCFVFVFLIIQENIF